MENEDILSDQEKERIRAEESYRAEIRQKLESTGRCYIFLAAHWEYGCFPLSS